jgi:hypothetical protein
MHQKQQRDATQRQSVLKTGFFITSGICKPDKANKIYMELLRCYFAKITNSLADMFGDTTPQVLLPTPIGVHNNTKKTLREK